MTEQGEKSGSCLPPGHRRQEADSDQASLGNLSKTIHLAFERSATAPGVQPLESGWISHGEGMLCNPISQ